MVFVQFALKPHGLPTHSSMSAELEAKSFGVGYFTEFPRPQIIQKTCYNACLSGFFHRRVKQKLSATVALPGSFTLSFKTCIFQLP